MEYTGQLVTGDFGDNTMTFKIDGEMTLQAGKYKIVQLEVGNAVKNNVDLDDVSSSGKCSRCEVNDAQSEHTCPYAEEINDDSDSLCDCCSDCEHECYMDI